MQDLPPIKDPTFVKKEKYSFWDKKFLNLIRDERDLPFIYICIQITLILGGSAIVQYLGVLSETASWIWFTAHLLIMSLYFLGPYTLMLHNTSHNPFFKKEYKFWNYYIPWVLGPLMGQSPETYFAHHMGMHHPENNLPEDDSCTMPYQRDSVRGFTKYFLSFMFIGVINVAKYFTRKNRPKLRMMLLRGEFLYILFCIGMSFISFQATLGVFLIPFVLARFGMMAGNWAQHAFVDATDPNNCYMNSITCINSTYNKRCFNDGYHIGHHVNANRHWTDMPADFIADKDNYSKNRAIVFEGIDYFMIWFMLMTKQYKALAKHFVNINHVFKTDEEIIEHMKTRLKKIAV